MKKYKWMSLTAGNIVETFGDVIVQIIDNLFRYHFLDLRWSYNRNGF